MSQVIVFSGTWFMASAYHPFPSDRKILDMLPDRPPEVTFSCDKTAGTCQFQFWTAQIESFYCALDTCTSGVKQGYDHNSTTYSCENIQCKCVPGRFICGEENSLGMCVRIVLYETKLIKLQILPTS